MKTTYLLLSENFAFYCVSAVIKVFTIGVQARGCCVSGNWEKGKMTLRVDTRDWIVKVCGRKR